MCESSGLPSYNGNWILPMTIQAVVKSSRTEFC